MAIFKKKLKDYSDESLMELIKQGDKHAFNELYERYSQRILHYFLRMLGGDIEKSQDFLQDIFLKIIEKPERFNTIKRFRSWIYTVASNMCKNEYRSMDVRKAVENSDRIDSITPHLFQNSIEQDLDHKIFGQAVLSELQKIDVVQRSTFLLRFQEDLPIKEISEIMSCSEGTIKSRLFYITKKLMKNLKDFNPNKFEV